MFAMGPVSPHPSAGSVAWPCGTLPKSSSLRGRSDDEPGWRPRPPVLPSALSAGAVLVLRRCHRPRRNALGAEESGPVRVVPLPLASWLLEVQLHPHLAEAINEGFSTVPQHSTSAIEETVCRIERGARHCVAPAARAHPFGSTVNGFGSTSSDIDVLISIEEEELCYYMSYYHWHQRERRFYHAQQKRVNEGTPLNREQGPIVYKVGERTAMACAVQQMADVLPEFGFRVLRSLPHARRPLLTVRDMTGELGECDVSINNRLPLCNTELLQAYSQLDVRVRPLVLLVKGWAKNRNVCGANEGNLSSYAWTIMVIYFLQLVNLLPSLQMMEKEPRLVVEPDYWGYVREFNMGFLPAEDYLELRRAPDGSHPVVCPQLSMADLIYGFFCFFSREYHWGSEVVSIRHPDRRSADAWWLLYGRPHPEPSIHVEDPVELRDLNIVLCRDRLAQLKVEFVRAVDVLESGGELDELMAVQSRRKR
mmetsp:Transcript_76861/g.178261  ORF Transcript_76861/g.178261 Transcript_76861/m.178261 type:complete len:479 (-) Transcript_76861:105-1541(-)